MGANSVSLCLTWVFLVHSSAMLSHVDRYEVVRPQRLPGRQKRSLRDGQLYPDTLQYQLSIEGRNHTIHLEKNKDLIGSGYTQTHYGEDGKRVTTSPNKDHCYYQGHIEGVTESSVSVGICSGISGFLRAWQQVYLIEPLGRSDASDHAVYRREQLKLSGTPGCGLRSNGTALYDRDQDPPHAGLFRSRSWKSKPVPGAQRFVELFVVVDNAEFKRYGSRTEARILEVINHVDKLYQPLNTRVLLVGLEIWTHKDHIEVDFNSETTLDNFLLWRQTELLQRRKHDTAQFVTGTDFDGDTVGLANKFAMCTDNSGGVNQDHHDNPIGLASTIAHEMGHNLGLSHDTAECVCGSSYSSSNCVMADKLRTGNQAFPEFFSDCSVKQLAEFMERARPACLSRPPSSVSTIALSPRCGDGLLDPGEECDCGGVEECTNRCCDASTCRLSEGSRCAHGQCCENCQVKAAGSVCRASASGCDLPEYCSGASEDCPEDGFEMNGKPCYDWAPGFCYDGRCPTQEQHCWRLFGAGARVGPDLCFNLNKRGEEGASCGRNKFSFTRCTPQNLKCGSIFCVGGGESITGKRAAYPVNGIDCKIVRDDDKSRKLDMVPQGTRCGADKVCHDNTCVDLSVYGDKEDCAKKCNSNGVCNHKRECHCNPGWAPPYCDVQFADLPQGQTGIIAGVCAVLFVLLVIAVVVVALMCCKKDNVETYASKRKVHSAPDRLNPMFQEELVKDRPQISQPTFMASTATQACAPLIVTVATSRPAPQPPAKSSSVSPTPQTKPTKPQPPSKPLPPVNKTQHQAAQPPVKPCTPPPPLPPAKPRAHRLT